MSGSWWWVRFYCLEFAAWLLLFCSCWKWVSMNSSGNVWETYFMLSKKECSVEYTSSTGSTGSRIIWESDTVKELSSNISKFSVWICFFSENGVPVDSPISWKQCRLCFEFGTSNTKSKGSKTSRRDGLMAINIRDISRLARQFM